MPPAFGPEDFAVGGMSITGIALGWWQGVRDGLQGLQATLQAHGLSDNQPGVAGDSYDEVDAVFFCCTKV
jgi:hypothetical protein